MISKTVDQLAALRRIALFSAGLRGHTVGEWRMGESFTQANCVRCGAGLRVYFPVIQPEMDGAALEQECTPGAVESKAA